MARGDSGTTTDNDDEWQWDWHMIEMLVMIGIVLLSSIPFFIGYFSLEAKATRKGSGKKSD